MFDSSGQSTWSKFLKSEWETEGDGRYQRDGEIATEKLKLLCVERLGWNLHGGLLGVAYDALDRIEAVARKSGR